MLSFLQLAMVHNSIAAAEQLQKEGVSVEVVNISTLKPLNKEQLLQFTKGKKAIVTAEEAIQNWGLLAIPSQLFIQRSKSSVETSCNRRSIWDISPLI